MLDDALCEKARLARDPRFDGRFFIAVRTTGVYCRPICRVRPPLRRNITFHPSAASAEEAGFRPCKRCRPETAPGTPAWLGSSAVVSRALRLIEEGALDRDGVEALAGRVGLGARQLRRLFVEHVGASPLAVARTRRTHFARRLIDETGLPLGEVALAAGFGSVRQFNDAVRQTFGRTPRALRRGRADARDAAGIRLRLPYREPFDWGALVGFLIPRAIPGVESVVDASGGAASLPRGAGGRRAARSAAALRYRRAIGRGSWVEIGPVPDAAALELRVHGDPPTDLIGLAARARRLFDLAADPARVRADLRTDPQLRPLLRRRPGLRVPGCWDPFEIGVRAILGQQVSVVGATTLAGRLVERFGDAVGPCPGEALAYTFPSPAGLAEADVAAIGMPRKRGEAVRSFARALIEGALVLDGATPLDETVAALRTLPGFGDWTAQYLAMRALGEPDAFPAGDLGLRKALGDGAALPNERSVRRRAEAWRPWRSYAAVHLWASLDDPAPRGRAIVRSTRHAASDLPRARGERR